jgi:predicted aspartyl protease
VVTSFDDWRVVEGMRFPFVARQSTGDARFDVVTRTESLTLPTSLPDAILERPAPRGISDVTWIDRGLARDLPLRSIGPLLGLDVSVNGGTPGPFLVDTGAGATVIAAETARRLGLSHRGVVEARGAGGSAAAAYVDVGTLALPGVEIRGQTLVALPLEEMSAALGTSIGGILGWDFLSRFAVEIDRVKQRVALFEAEYAPPPGAVRIDLRLEANVPRIEGVIEGQTGSFLLDTGNAVPLLLHTDFAERHGFLERATESSFSMAGVGGTTAMREVRVNSLRLGPLEFRDVAAVLAPDGEGVVALQESLGNVGASLFAGRVLALDYGAGALWVGPAAGSAAATADSASAR